MVQLSWQAGSAVLVARDEVDTLTVPLIERAIRIAASGHAEVVVDLRPCPYFGACGIGMLVRLKKLCGDRLTVLVASGTIVERIFQITQMVDALGVRSVDQTLGRLDTFAALRKARDASAGAASHRDRMAWHTLREGVASTYASRGSVRSALGDSSGPE